MKGTIKLKKKKSTCMNDTAETKTLNDNLNSIYIVGCVCAHRALTVFAHTLLIEFYKQLPFNYRMIVISSYLFNNNSFVPS